MISAFGIDHGTVSKRILPDRMPDGAAAVLPGTSVRLYDESPRKRKISHAAQNFAVKTATGAAVGLGTAGAIRLGLHRAKPMVKTVKAGKKSVSYDLRRLPVGTVVGGSIGGSAAAYAGQQNYKKLSAENRRLRR